MILHSLPPLSLNCPIEGTDRDVELEDSIVGPEDTAEEVIKTMMGLAVRKAVDSLPPKQRQVIQLRFGLNDGRVRTLEETGEAVGLTRERIRQLECKGLKNLRASPKVREKLAGFLN